MKKIIVIGAGHGGLTAAIKLSREGYDVTIYEKQKKGTLGHDWEDCFSPTLLKDYAGIDTPLQWRYNQSSSFVSPAKRTRINLDGDDITPHQYLWRKPALELLTSEAEAAGAKIIYEANATAPIESGGVVTGAVIDGKDVFADLVIDAAGVLSPIRSKLSDACAIEQNLNRGDVFYAYRAYFDNLDTENKAFKAFEIYLYHNREQGLSWCTTNDDNVDVLIGRIDPITKEQVEKQIESFREDHKHIGTKILNGGQTGIIPVRRPLSIMVCDGYAAVGDSAFMTEPMNGSGINLSVKAGALLADTIIKHKGVCTAQNLWDYNRDYHKMYGAECAKNESLKNSLLNLSPDAVDFFFDNAIIESSDLESAGKSTAMGAMVGKLVRGMKHPAWFFGLLGGILKGAKLAKVYENPPETYDKGKVDAWAKKIDSLKVTISN